jgi:hypothetical protein
MIEASSFNINDFFYEKNQRDKLDIDIKKFKIHNGNTFNESLIGKIYYNLNILEFIFIFFYLLFFYYFSLR